ncbi:MAG: hypothetical protein IPM99_06020 [Rubrivivax sp.]|nr:hypothetical protein [Rubrivivax sp.]
MSPIRVSRAGLILQAASVVFDFGAVLFQWRPPQLLQQVVPNWPRRTIQRPPPGDADSGASRPTATGRASTGRIDEAALARRIAARIGAPRRRCGASSTPSRRTPQAQPATVALLSG